VADVFNYEEPYSATRDYAVDLQYLSGIEVWKEWITAWNHLAGLQRKKDKAANGTGEMPSLLNLAF